MKTCPQCAKTFPDEYKFCLTDGVTLVAETKSSEAQSSEKKNNTQTKLFKSSLAFGISGLVTIILLVVVTTWFSGGKTDNNLEKEIKARISNPAINVSVKDGVVTLSGTVEKQDYSKTALSQAKGEGVKDVIDRIQIKPSASTFSSNTASSYANKSSETSSAIRRSYRGTANGVFIEMELTKDGSNLEGTITSQGNEVPVSGTKYSDDTFILREYDDIGNQTGTYSGRFLSNGDISATWRKYPNGRNDYPVSLEVK